MAGFADGSRQLARSLRALPKEVRAELATEVAAQVTVPLAAAIEAGAAGPYGARIAAAGGIKVRRGTEPVIAIGGGRQIFSGGARGRDVLHGTEFGTFGTRTAVVNHRGGTTYRRRTTRQFLRHHRPFVYTAVRSRAQAGIAAWADIVIRAIERTVRGGS